MPANVSKLCIIVPIFDEAESLPRLKEELDKFLEKSPVSTTVLLVNDGSQDDSQHIIEGIAGVDNRYQYLKLRHNRGLSTALKAGIDYSQSEWIGYIDADLQTSPLDFLLLLNSLPEYDLVTGIRKDRKDSAIKKASSIIANTIRRMIIHDDIEDTGCPLKIAKASYFKTIPFFKGMHRFIPAMIKMAGGQVKQIPVRHFPRLEGKPKYNLLNRLIGPLFDTFAFRWMQKHYIHYEIDKKSE